MKQTTLIGIGIAVVLALVALMTAISTNNKATGLENQAAAKQDECKLVYDGMWKTVSQKGQVADKYESAFREIFPKLIEGRYGNERGDTLMKFIVESNPNFDPSLLKDLSRYIESSRESFIGHQTVLRDLKREHDDLRTKFPSSLFVGGRKPIEVTLVTSSRTEDTFRSGKEDDVKVFPDQR